MRIKNVGNHKREVVYICIASVLALCLLTYLVFLVDSLTGKAKIVFGTEGLKAGNEQSFNFEKYDALMKQIYPGSTTVLSGHSTTTPVKTAATSTPAAPPSIKITTSTPATSTTATSTKK